MLRYFRLYFQFYSQLFGKLRIIADGGIHHRIFAPDFQGDGRDGFRHGSDICFRSFIFLLFNQIGNGVQMMPEVMPQPAYFIVKIREQFDSVLLIVEGFMLEQQFILQPFLFYLVIKKKPQVKGGND